MNLQWFTLMNGGNNFMVNLKVKMEKHYIHQVMLLNRLTLNGAICSRGRRILLETILKVKTPNKDIELKEADNNLDSLNYLAGKTMDFVNTKAFEGTLLAHTDGGVPNFVVELPDMSEFTFGYLVYFFEKAVAISGYMQGLNPFDQPGVEAYKKNMFALLGKPGFEDLKAELEDRLK